MAAQFDLALSSVGGCHGGFRGRTGRSVSTLKEAFASSSALATAKLDAGSNELVKAVIAEIETSEGRSAIEGALLKRFASTKPADVAAS